MDAPLSASFEQQAKSTIAASEARIEEIDSQIRDLLYQRDQEHSLITALKLVIAPIRKVPVELLVEIFHQALWWSSTLKKVLALSHVCVFWRRVACKTPALWRISPEIDIGRTSAAYTAATKLWLERSAPLAIRIRLSASADVKDSPELVKLLLDVAHRWATFTAHDAVFPELAKLGPGALKQLQVVELSYWKSSKCHPTTSAFLTATRLRSVTLAVSDTARFPMPWAQLKYLNLEDSDPQLCLDILLQCTDIVSAKINSRAWSRLPPAPAVATITLPRLEDLSLEFGPGRADHIAPIFERMTVPNLRKMHIWIEPWPPETSDAFTQFQDRAPNLEELSIQSCDLSSDELHAILVRAPSLTKLELESCFHCIDDFLLDELTYSPLDAVHLAPRLQTLNLYSISDRFAAKKMGKMVRSRWWSDKNLQALTQPPAVARWKRVNISCDDEEKFEPALQAKMEQYRSEGLDVDLS
ncbi:hypothetical protein B0H17DRAFT_1174756 [Mycena rosella]|uniref:F-box domain-containing protein n=1 Tax=Mycena rosella TaxID=1033263 RepID=A0AAD7GWN9_MYCRO|nr:hypothetical protein B0H17DRAFT_1174756 [Mycena rosella]